MKEKKTSPCEEGKIIRMKLQAVRKDSRESSLKEKTAKGLFWGGISNFIQQVVGMAFGILIARILSPDDYGLVAMLSIFTAIANTVMDSGFTTALINRKTIEHRDYNAVFWFNVFIAIGVYIILFFFAPAIADFYKDRSLIGLSRVLFLSFIITSIGAAHNAYLLKKIMAKQRGIIDVVAVFCSGIVGLVLALNGFAFWGLVAQQLTQISAAVLLRWYYSPWRPTFEFDFTPLKEMFGFGAKIFTTNIFYQVTGNLFPAVLGHYYGTTLTGYYIQGSKWASLSSSVVLAGFNNVAQPVLVEAMDNTERQLKIFRKILRFGAFLVFPSLLGLAFIGKEFVWIVLGEKWIGSVFFLQLFCLWGVNSFFQSLYSILLLSHQKSNIYMVLTILLFSSQLLCLLIGTRYDVDIKLILDLTVCIFLLSTIGWHYFASRLIGICVRNVVRDVFPYIGATIIAIAVASLLSRAAADNLYLSLAVKIVATAIVYMIILWVMGSSLLKEAFLFLRINITHSKKILSLYGKKNI